jgi:hypothetical protein
MRKTQGLCNRACLTVVAAGLLMSSTAGAIPLEPRQLVVSEVMANPAAVSDNRGEWFELYNIGNTAVDLDGFVLSDDGTNSHVISGTSLLITPGAYFVLGRDGDPSANGGYTPDYVYDGFTLSNAADEIILSQNGVEQLRLAYVRGSAFGTKGISVEIRPGATFPYNASDYQLTASAMTYGDGDRGSPGEAGGTGLAHALPEPSTGWLVLAGVAVPLFVTRRSIERA